MEEEKIYEKDGVKVKAIPGSGRGCNECFFGRKIKDNWWGCTGTGSTDGWEVPDCVDDFPLWGSVIYVEVKDHADEKVAGERD